MARILCPVLVGRERELAELDAAIEAARQGRGGVVFVRGPAGIGKSRLLSEAGERARSRGLIVLAGRCAPARVPVPYRPIAEALVAATPGGVPHDSAALAGFRTALGWIVPAWREDPDAAPAESPVVVVEALVRELHAIGAGRAAALLIEDLQWADPETLHAVEYLADHATQASTICICAVRDPVEGEVQDLVARLDARRATGVIRLAPLDSGAVGEMAMRSLEVAALAPEVAALLDDSADGVPFLVEELLAAAVDSGALVRTGETWTASAPLGGVVPQSFAATVHERLAPLGPDGRRFLCAAALLGRAFSWRLAARAADCDDGTAHGLLERAVGLQLLTVQAAAFTFRHALTRDAILGELLPDERARLAGRCLDLLEASVTPGADWQHLAADLAEAAGDPDRAARHLLDAGRASLQRGALDTATSALDRAIGVARDGALRADICELLAEAGTAAGDIRRTQPAVERLLDALRPDDTWRARRGRAHLLLARCAVTATHFALASEELARARRDAASADDPALSARVGAVAAELAIAENRVGEAEALALRAADDAMATSQPDVVCEALEVASRCARTRNLDEARHVSDRAVHVAEEAHLAAWRMRGLYQLGIVELFETGDIDTLCAARAAAMHVGAVGTAATMDLEIAAGLEAQHRVAEARETCRRCIEMSRLLDLRIIEAVAHLFEAVIDAGTGDREHMEAAISRAMDLAGDDPELAAAAWGDARAIASLGDEDRTRARGELEHAVALYPDDSPSTPRLATALLPLVIAVGGGEPDLSRARGVTLVNGQCAGYLAYAHAVQLGRKGLRADADAAALRGDGHLARLPWYRNLVRRLAAEVALEDGWGAPVTWLTEASEYFAGVGGDRLSSAARALLRRAGVRVSRPTRAAAALPAGLRRAGVTPREAEVLGLLGEGLSNRAIAARLFLSERTVEQHVSGLKRKLALETRAQLAVYAAANVAARG